jgi:hypothetical protein
MPQRTLGYIVVNASGEVLRWHAGAFQFFRAVYSSSKRNKTTMFDDYEFARKCIAWHYNTIHHEARKYPENYRHLQALSIVSLNAPERIR